jgi:integrase
MPRTIGKLSALGALRAAKIGLHADGGGLYLQVGASGAKSWIYRFMLKGQVRDMGLGSYREVPLAEARKRATAARLLRSAGIDPIESRQSVDEQSKMERARSMTFKACAEAYIEATRPSWRNAKHAEQWTSSFATYVYPTIGSFSVHKIDTVLVLKVVEPLWTKKTITAQRLLGRMERVLDWAATRGARAGENPARWRGHIENVLPNPTKLATVKHHSALPHDAVPLFITELRERDGLAKLALEFLILTAARSSEVLGARWTEIDLGQALWIIPGSRMKSGLEHRVPLSDAALEVLRVAQRDRPSDFVFPSAKRIVAMSHMAFQSLLKRMHRSEITTHGFRSTFRDWVAEQTNHSREVAEMALAHAITNKVEAAYRRGDLLVKRRQLMEDWGRYCSNLSPKPNVISLRSKAVTS